MANSIGDIMDGLKNMNLKETPFKFQLKLAEFGIKGVNNIICLRTGGGKTLISAIICKYWYLKYQECNNLDKFKVAFIVPTRHLASQQCNAYTGAFSEEDDLMDITENNNTKRVAECFKNRKILFITAQKLINTVKEGLLELFNFTILVFDECHHTTELHPYSEIMHLYFEEKERYRTKKAPIIIGLSASLGVGKGESVVEHLVRLCANLDCKQIDHLKDQVLIDELNTSMPSPHSDTISVVEQNQKNKEIYKHIINTIMLISEKANIVHSLNLYLKIGLPEYESFVVEEKKKADTNLNCREKSIALKYLRQLHWLHIRYNDFTIESCLKMMQDFYDETNVENPEPMEEICRQLFRSLMNEMESVKDQIPENPKLTRLIELIKANHQPNSRGLILVKTKYHTKALLNFIKGKECLKDLIKADRLTGQGSIEEDSMTDTKQNEVLDLFRNGTNNLLISTDIAQEGLDIPQCNYVIRYEFVVNEIATVQSRGRARADGSKCYLITYENSFNHKKELENRQKEKEMYEAMKLWDQVPEDVFKKLFEEQRNEMANKHNKRSEQANTPPDQIQNSGNNVKVMCRECSTILCNGNDIRYREPNYLCIKKEFVEKIKIDRQSLKYYCSNSSCEKELGTVVVYKKGAIRESYNLNIKSLKFFHSKNDIKVHAQWSKITFKVDPIFF